MTTTVNYSNIDQNRPASWKQMKAINTRVADLLAKKFKKDIKELRPIVGALITNQDNFTHGEAQKYFKIEKVTQLDKALVAEVAEALKNPKAKKAAPKRAAKKAAPSEDYKGVADTLNLILMQTQEIKDKQGELDDRLIALETK